MNTFYVVIEVACVLHQLFIRDQWKPQPILPLQPHPNPARLNTWVPCESQRSTYFERRRGGGADPGQAAAAAAAWVWLCAWWDSLAPACFGSLGGAGSQSPVSQSGLISQMQGIHSLCKARRDRKREREGGGREKEREGLNETKLFGSMGFIYPCTFLTYPHTASAGADRG